MNEDQEFEEYLREFEEYLREISEYAKKAGVSIAYVEMEFILDGELIQLPINN